MFFNNCLKVYKNYSPKISNCCDVNIIKIHLLLNSIQHHPPVTKFWLFPNTPTATATMFMVSGTNQLIIWHQGKIILLPKSRFSYTITIYRYTAKNIVHKNELIINDDPIKLCIIQSLWSSFPYLYNPTQFDKEEIKSDTAMHTIIWRAGVLMSLNIKNVTIIMLAPNIERTLTIVNITVFITFVPKLFSYWVLFIFTEACIFISCKTKSHIVDQMSQLYVSVFSCILKLSQRIKITFI